MTGGGIGDAASACASASLDRSHGSSCGAAEPPWPPTGRPPRAKNGDGASERPSSPVEPSSSAGNASGDRALCAPRSSRRAAGAPRNVEDGAASAPSARSPRGVSPLGRRSVEGRSAGRWGARPARGSRGAPSARCCGRPSGRGPGRGSPRGAPRPSVRPSLRPSGRGGRPSGRASAVAGRPSARGAGRASGRPSERGARPSPPGGREPGGDVPAGRGSRPSARCRGAPSRAGLPRPSRGRFPDGWPVGIWPAGADPPDGRPAFAAGPATAPDRAGAERGAIIGELGLLPPGEPWAAPPRSCDPPPPRRRRRRSPPSRKAGGIPSGRDVGGRRARASRVGPDAADALRLLPPGALLAEPIRCADPIETDGLGDPKPPGGFCESLADMSRTS